MQVFPEALFREDFCCTESSSLDQGKDVSIPLNGIGKQSREASRTARENDYGLSIVADHWIEGMIPHNRLSFSKRRRLTCASEFERVKRDGTRQHGKLLTIASLYVAEAGPFRAGIVTSRRLGSAVVRNRVRRRLREIVRRHQNQMRDNLWIVIVAKSEAARASYAALEDEWLRLAKRASILAT